MLEPFRHECLQPCVEHEQEVLDIGLFTLSLCELGFLQGFRSENGVLTTLRIPSFTLCCSSAKLISLAGKR